MNERRGELFPRGWLCRGRPPRHQRTHAPSVLLQPSRLPRNGHCPFRSGCAPQGPLPLHPDVQDSGLSLPQRAGAVPKKGGEAVLWLTWNPPFPILPYSGRIPLYFWGTHQTQRRTRLIFFRGLITCSIRRQRDRRRSTSLWLLRGIFPHRTPVGRKTARHSQPGESSLLYAKALGAPAPCWLAG